jgi:hypothetical protein
MAAWFFDFQSMENSPLSLESVPFSPKKKKKKKTRSPTYFCPAISPWLFTDKPRTNWGIEL